MNPLRRAGVSKHQPVTEREIIMKIAFIGGGNMGEAILASLLEKKLCKPRDISVSDIAESRRDYLNKKYGVTVTAFNKEAVSGKEVIVLAIKPQQMNEALASFRDSVKPAQMVLSIAAGVKINTISNGLRHDIIVRSMPNTPAQLGLGMTGWTATSSVTGEQKALARKILGAMGKEIYFDEETALDMVTAVSGSGPAYFYLFAEALIDAAVEIGLTRKDAEILVKQTMLGAAHLMDSSDKAPTELRRNVTSKGGTTEQAIKVFEESGLVRIAGEAVKAACRRAEELGKQ
jgi:pyrroline-5-carboxylate reductase